MDTDIINQGSISRGWLETKRQHTGLLFWIVELIAGGIVAAMTENPWAGPGAMGGIVIAILLYNIFQAPVWQRNEAREMLTSSTPFVGTDALAEFLKNRDYFTMKEAACLLAGVELSNSELSGVADAQHFDLKSKVLDGKIQVLDEDQNLKALKLSRRMPFGGIDPLDQIRNYKLSRETVASLGVKID